MRPKVNTTSDSDLESVFSTEEPKTSGKKLNEGKYVCSFDGCGQSFTRMVHLDRHEFKHTGVKKHPCFYDDCNKSYTNITHLKRHIKATHEKVKKTKDVKCRFDFCSKTFSSEYNMERHIRQVHENPKVYTCSQCNEKFKQKIKLRRHEVKHTGVCPFNCEKCNKGFLQEYFFQRHICKSYKCNVCEKLFEKWSELMAHRKAENHRESVHKCEHCGKIFKTKHNLIDHETTHKDDKEVFQCTYEGCKRFYSHQRNLVQHIRVAHEGHNFPCTVEGCEVKLLSQRALQNHIKVIHSNGRVESKSKKSKSSRAQRKDAGTRKRSALSKISGVIIDKEVDKMVMEGTAEIEINLSEVTTQAEDDVVKSDVEDPSLVALEVVQL